jgi:hypothetical protein
MFGVHTEGEDNNHPGPGCGLRDPGENSNRDRNSRNISGQIERVESRLLDRVDGRIR